MVQTISVCGYCVIVSVHGAHAAVWMLQRSVRMLWASELRSSWLGCHAVDAKRRASLWAHLGRFRVLDVRCRARECPL
eukprot:7283158-Pyramimonas_sp.AAC.1